MAAPGRRLMLLRHAKSDWGDPRLADIERPLAPRGRRAAAVIGTYLRKQALIPDLVVTSPAARTRQTIELLNLGHVRVEADRAVYGGGAEELLDRLRSVPDDVRVLMLVGHNPDIARLATLLVDDEGRALVGSYPTGALTVMEPDTPSWSELAWSSCRLLSYVTPKSLPGKDRS